MGTKHNPTKIKNLEEVFKVVLNVYPRANPAHILLFLEIAKSPEPIWQSDLVKIGYAETPVSRFVANFGDHGSRSATRTPLKLIKQYIDPDQRDQRLLSLTAKGRKFYDDLLGALA